MRVKLTTRLGPRVARRSFDDLDGALEGLNEELDRARRDGGLPEVNLLRRFEPGDRVAARIELSTGGLLRGRTAGVDLMGDGALVAYAGGIGRRELDLKRGESVTDALRRELTA